MPAKGGAFFGFAIIVAAALITWGIIALVDVADDSSDDDGSRSIESSELQDALNDAGPGDIIYIPEGTHEVSLTTTVAGTEDDPITITCETGDRDDCILKGDGNARVLEILHSWYVIEEFTIDGQESSNEFKEQLIFVQGTGEPEEVEDGVYSAITGITIQRMNLRNAGNECVRFRYFVTNSVVDECLIGPCGIEDFVLEDNNESNGEGVYIGTALNQINSKGDEYPQLDICSGIVVMNSRIETQGSEGVDIKEGSFGNIVYRNEISGQMDVDAGGVSLRGSNNIVYNNWMLDGEGSCVRIGGDEYDDNDYGFNNEVYQNDFIRCRYSSIKVNESPQLICENTVTEADVSDQNDDTLYATVRGDAADDFPHSVITSSCEEEPTSIHDRIRVGTRFDFGNDDNDVTYSDRDLDIDDDSVEEDDDPEPETGSAYYDEDLQGADTYVYVGCFFSGASTSEELFDALALDDDNNLSVPKCVLSCVNLGYEFAGLQNGSQCWCGDQFEFSKYGDGLCNSACTDTDSTSNACGGIVSFSLYIIYGDGGIDSDDQGDDDGGLGADEGTTPTPSPVVEITTGDDDPGYSVSVVDQDYDEPEPVEEDDDEEATDPGGDLLGCYQDSDNNPILSFLYEDEDNLTPASCVADCANEGEELAGLQNGQQCWCGTTDDYDKYGTSTCNINCSGDPSQTCGGVNSSNVYRID
eukprot:g15872.t1